MRKLFLGIIILLIVACENTENKGTQSITFGEIAPQNLKDSFLILNAVSSSRLPVRFVSSDTTTAYIVDSTVVFRQAGVVTITAVQAGDEQFYEAPNVSRRLIIRNWDLNKKTQTISFSLVNEWKISNGIILQLEGVASSGLSVTYTSSDWRATVIERELYLQHGTSYYDIWAQITASQSGNSECNPADNVTCTIHVIGDEKH